VPGTLLLLALLAAGLVLGALALGYYGSGQVLAGSRPAQRPTPAQFATNCEDVVFPSRDGLDLRGWYIAAPGSSATVIYCPGRGSGLNDFDFRYIPLFIRHGFNLLLFDFRASGASSGTRATLGYLEQNDLLGALDFLQQEKQQDNIGVFGTSLGAAVAILTAARTPALRAVAGESAFATYQGAIYGGIKQRGVPGFVARPWAGLVTWWLERRLGFRSGQVDPVNWIARLEPRPVLLIHGDRDRYLDLRHPRALFAAARGPKELWIISGAGHTEGLAHSPQEFEARVTDFFRRWLRQGPPAQAQDQVGFNRRPTLQTYAPGTGATNEPDPRCAEFYLPGGDTACLLIHGFGGSPAEMRGMGEYLAARGLTVLGVRLAGHGTTPEDMAGTGWREWVASAERALSSLLVKNAVFAAGLSMGAAIALHLSTRYPVRGVIAMAPALFLGDWRASLVPAIKLFRKWHYFDGSSDLTDPTALSQIVSYDRVAFANIASLMELQRQVRASLPQVAVPLLVMQGRQDRTIPINNAQYLYDHAGSQEKRLVWYANSGHGLVVDSEKDRVWQEAFDFIALHSSVVQ